MTGTPRILTLDIETAPAWALVFGQYKQTISNVQIIKPDRVIAFAAKWHGEPEVMFFSEYHDGQAEMLRAFRDLVSQADIVIHFNGKSFDMPWMRRMLAEKRMGDLSPSHEIDLYLVAKNRFRYGSYKLENLAMRFGVGAKMDNGGFQLWRDIEVGSERQRARAWAKMKRYCMRDVVITERLYDRLRPYIHNHPHMGLWAESDADLCCPNCQSQKRRPDGFYATKQGLYPKWQCAGCGKYYRRTTAAVLVRAVGTP